MEISQTVFGRNPDIVFAQMGDELVMMSEEQGQYLGLNVVAADIWQLLATPMSFTALCEALQHKYQVSAEKCAADVQLFLQQMLQRELLIIKG